MSGLTNYSLSSLLTTSCYVGFFTTAPDDYGAGGTEASGGGYARENITAWVNSTSNGIRYRANDGAIEFSALTADLEDVVAWGIWDASTNGNLIAWGPLLDVSGNEITKTFTSGNYPRFPDGELKIGLED